MSSEGNTSLKESLEIPVAGNETCPATSSNASPKSPRPIIFKPPSLPIKGKFRNPFSKRSKQDLKSELKRKFFKKSSGPKPLRRCPKCGVNCNGDKSEFCRIDYVKPKKIRPKNVESKTVSPKNVPVNPENDPDTDAPKIAINICSCGKANCIGCFPICNKCGSQKCGEKCLNSFNSMYRIDYI